MHLPYTLQYQLLDSLANNTARRVAYPNPLPPFPHRTFIPLLTVFPAILILGFSSHLERWFWYAFLAIYGCVAACYLLWGLTPLLRWLAYFRIRSSLTRPFRKLPHRNVSWVFTDRGFTFESALRTVRGEWIDLNEIILAMSFHTLRLRSGEDIAIPDLVLPPEVGNWIIRKAHILGIPVRHRPARKSK